MARNYAAELKAQGVAPASIFAHGIAFQGKDVLARGGWLAYVALSSQAGSQQGVLDQGAEKRQKRASPAPHGAGERVR